MKESDGLPGQSCTKAGGEGKTPSTTSTSTAVPRCTPNPTKPKRIIISCWHFSAKTAPQRYQRWFLRWAARGSTKLTTRERVVQGEAVRVGKQENRHTNYRSGCLLSALRQTTSAAEC